MKFAKYHGIGNDFILFADPSDELVLTPQLVRKLCERHFGIGADGVIRVGPGKDGGELFMDHFNSDGSIPEMCGNGIRCLARFALEEGLTRSTELKVTTRAGLKVVIVEGEDVRVDMGSPVFEPAAVPVRWDEPDALRAKVQADDALLQVACLSMGNPHAVIFSEDLQRDFRYGPLIERHDMFPHATNVEFVQVLSAQRLKVWVWERGAGRTLACGTGACAAAVAARLLRGADPQVRVELPGGELEVEWLGSRDDDAPVFLAGPVEKSFEGRVDLEAYAG